MIRVKSLTLLFSLQLFAGVLCAQDAARKNLASLITKVNANSNELGIEKLYVQTDKSIYASSDTLWFKAYLLDAAYMSASQRSGLMYIELADDSSRVSKRVMVLLMNGIGFGQLPLSSKEFPEGNYTLTAYTSWMRNFCEQYVFRKQLSIAGTKDDQWLINYRAIRTKENANDIALQMTLSQLNRTPVASRELRMAVTEKRKTIFRDAIQTAPDGSVNVRFPVPETTPSKDLFVSVQNLERSVPARKIIVPLVLNRPEFIDLQFMPEGGQMIAGVESRIAFKAINEDGYGAEVSGLIVDGNKRQASSFRSVHKGMGNFRLTPVAGEVYSAIIKLPGGQEKQYALPAVQTTGMMLQVINHASDDSLTVVIVPSKDLISSQQTYLLMAQSRNLVCYGATFTLNNGALKYTISRKTFPTGVVRFTINHPTTKQTLYERSVYVQHNDQLRIKLGSSKASYQQREAISLMMEVSDKNGNPVQGSFSLAVTDDGQVPRDSTGNHSIATQLLLITELKGTVESPGYYFAGGHTEEKWQHLDLLLLTQGWVGYDWNQMQEPLAGIKHPAETSFRVRGRVTNMFNKPVAGAPVALLAKDPFLIIDTVTNALGDFEFDNVMPGDTSVFFIQSKNKKNKSFNVGIEMYEFEPPVFTPSAQRIIPWYVNVDTGRIMFANRQKALKKEMEEITGVKTLQEVFVTAKKIIRDSKNLNGPGEADYIITEEELEKAGRRTLGDLIAERVPGFGVKTNKTGTRFFAIHSTMVHLIIDGMNTEFFLPGGLSVYDYLKQYFDYYDAEEIKGIEVMSTGRYQMRYTSEFLSPMASPWDHSFIEVTTRGGRGPFVKKAVGTFLYRPMPFIIPRKFYSPAYPVKSTPDMTDTRSTIFWEPNIITGKDGKATIEFYAADNPGSYSVVVEGSDLDGNIGSGRSTIRIEK